MTSHRQTHHTTTLPLASHCTPQLGRERRRRAGGDDKRKEKVDKVGKMSQKERQQVEDTVDDCKGAVIRENREMTCRKENEERYINVEGWFMCSLRLSRDDC